MEGISGVTSINQIHSDGAEYDRARKRMTAECNLIIEELFTNGVKEVVVNDAHGSMDNLIYEELDSRASLIRGRPKEWTMMAGIDSTFDGVFLIGYHSRPGQSQAVLDHVYSGKVFSIKLNGQELGESGLNGRLAGYFEVPVLFISGDEKTTELAREELGKVVTAPVKKAQSRYSALLYPRKQVESNLREGVKKALDNIGQEPIQAVSPCELQLSVPKRIMTEVLTMIPGVEVVDNRTVQYVDDDYKSMYQVLQLMLKLLRNV